MAVVFFLVGMVNLIGENYGVAIFFVILALIFSEDDRPRRRR